MKRREQSPSPPHEEYSFPASAGFFMRFAFRAILCTVLFYRALRTVLFCVLCFSLRMESFFACRKPRGAFRMGCMEFLPGRTCSGAFVLRGGCSGNIPASENVAGAQKQHSARRNVLRRGKGCAKIEPRNRNTNNETRIRNIKEIQRDEKEKFG